MRRPATQAGPMRLVQCDGFAVYAGAGAQKSQGPARRRLTPALRSGPRPVKRRAVGPTGHGAAVLARPAAWSIGLQSMVVASILMGLFGAYSLGRVAASSGGQSGLAYARPVVLSAESERLSPNPYLR